MLLHRYGNIEYALRLPIKRAIKLIEYAQKEENKEYYLRHYLTVYPNMDKKTYKPFEKVYEEILGSQKKVIYDDRPIDEIMEELSKINL